MSKYVIYFKGGLKSIDAIAPSGSNSNYTFAGPCGCDSPVLGERHSSNSTDTNSEKSTFINFYCLVVTGVMDKLEEAGFLRRETRMIDDRYS